MKWAPAWKDQACAIVATGASAKRANINALRGKVKVIAIKEAAVDLCPWADVVYGCDAPWWRHRKGLPDFTGLKIGWDEKIPFQDVHRIEIKNLGDKKTPKYVNKILVDELGVIGGGLLSGFQAFNLAIQFGAKRVLLVGYDFRGAHYYGRNDWFKCGNPDEGTFTSALKIWNDQADFIRSLGVQVINANNDSALKCFPKHSIEDTLQMWGL